MLPALRGGVPPSAGHSVPAHGGGRIPALLATPPRVPRAEEGEQVIGATCDAIIRDSQHIRRELDRIIPKAKRKLAKAQREIAKAREACVALRTALSSVPQ